MDLRRDNNPSHPELDMALTGALLKSVASRQAMETTRIFCPGPTVAFGRRDRLLPGFDNACDVARRYGYEPLVRLAGGRAVAYDGSSILIEVVRPEDVVISGAELRFIDLSMTICRALMTFGVSLELGELDDEYCPGRFSLHLPGGPKVAGIAQRAIRGASLTTAALAVAPSEKLRTVTVDVYAALGLPLDPATVGAIGDQFPDVTVDAVANALAQYA